MNFTNPKFKSGTVVQSIHVENMNTLYESMRSSGNFIFISPMKNQLIITRGIRYPIGIGQAPTRMRISKTNIEIVRTRSNEGIEFILSVLTKLGVVLNGSYYYTSKIYNGDIKFNQFLIGYDSRWDVIKQPVFGPTITKLTRFYTHIINDTHRDIITTVKISILFYPTSKRYVVTTISTYYAGFYISADNHLDEFFRDVLRFMYTVEYRAIKKIHHWYRRRLYSRSLSGSLFIKDLSDMIASYVY